MTNLSTSRLVEDVAARFGQRVIRASVGEGYVVDRAVEEDAVLAGEGNGGVGSLPATMTFDAALTLGMVLEHFSTTDDDPAAIARELPDYVMRKGAFPVPPDQVYRVIEEFRATYSDGILETSDGLRVDWTDAWLHVRASNTEPLLRIIVEADSKERSDSLFQSAMALGRNAVMRRGDT